MERAQFLARHDGGLGGPGGLHCPVRDGHHRIDPWIDGLDTVKVCLNHFDRRKFPLADQLGKLDGVLIEDFRVHDVCLYVNR
ncbi:hypothetical protein D3C87_1217480 [compost metagenome]